MTHFIAYFEGIDNSKDFFDGLCCQDFDEIETRVFCLAEIVNKKKISLTHI